MKLRHEVSPPDSGMPPVQTADRPMPQLQSGTFPHIFTGYTRYTGYPRYTGYRQTNATVN